MPTGAILSTIDKSPKCHCRLSTEQSLPIWWYYYTESLNQDVISLGLDSESLFITALFYYFTNQKRLSHFLYLVAYAR